MVLLFKSEETKKRKKSQKWCKNAGKITDLKLGNLTENAKCFQPLLTKIAIETKLFCNPCLS